MPRQLIFLMAAALALACGSSRTPTEQPVSALEVRPPKAEVLPLAVQPFALVPSTVSVSWSVTETNGGSVTQAGLYTAPGYSGVFHVVATSTTNTAVSGQALVTVESGVAISAPSPVNANACESVQLSATMTGSTDTVVNWSVPSTCGSITATGAFTSLRGTGTCVVTAQAHADISKTASVTVNVTQERVLSVAVTPGTVTLLPAGTRAFSATVTTPCGTFPAGT
jgi:hypothetical protein